MRAGQFARPLKRLPWRPALAGRKGAAKHTVLTEEIVAAFEAGRLRPQDRMPTHRDLARDLGVSVQTVSLSYKEAERRGYLRGEVGRGTFVATVSPSGPTASCSTAARRDDRSVDRPRRLYRGARGGLAQVAMAALAESDNSAFMRPCRPIAGLDRHRAGRARLAAAARRRGRSPSAS